jgi:hypothetical protein
MTKEQILEQQEANNAYNSICSEYGFFNPHWVLWASLNCSIGTIEEKRAIVKEWLEKNKEE